MELSRPVRGWDDAGLPNPGKGDRGVSILLVIGALAVLAAWVAVVVARKRAARRAAVARARLRARRRRLPVVSANLRGLEFREPGLSFDDRDARDA